MSIHGTEGQVQSLEKSFQIVDLLKERNGMMLNELDDQLPFARSTIHNHLTTLVHEGFVVREANTYHIGLAFLHYGEYARHRKPEYRLAREHVERLADQTNEEVDFTVPEQGRMISLYHAVGDDPSSSLQVGSRFYMHNTAAGKSILAEMDPEEVAEIVAHWGLPADTAYSTTTPEALETALEAIRERGYAINEQELLEGFRSVAMTVHYPNERLFGALSVGGPTYRIGADRDSNVVRSLRQTVESFERQLVDKSHDEDNWWREFRDTPDERL